MTDEMAQAGGAAPRRGRSWWQHPGVLVVAVAVAASVVAVVLSLGRSDDDVDENFNPTTPTAFPAERAATAGIAAELH